MRRIILAIQAAALLGCGGDGAPEVGDDPNPAPASGVPTLPLFVRPFTGDYPVLNYFDHDIPNGGGTPSGGYQLTWQGERAIPGIHIGGYDGHTGIDWGMPVGTPLYAVVDGLVVFAGETAPAYCRLSNETVTATQVIIGHRTASGDVYIVVYNHMSSVDVRKDDRVTAGQRIGASGATGCIMPDRTPHLHLNVAHTMNTNGSDAANVDPYGWQGSGADPWALHPEGATSVWLWQPGQAPSLVR